MESLIKNISKLSIIERELITATKIMDQERLIKINTNKIDSMTQLFSFDYFQKLSTGLDLRFSKYFGMDTDIANLVCTKYKDKKDKLSESKLQFDIENFKVGARIESLCKTFSDQGIDPFNDFGEVILDAFTLKLDKIQDKTKL